MGVPVFCILLTDYDRAIAGKTTYIYSDISYEKLSDFQESITSNSLVFKYEKARKKHINNQDDMNFENLF